MRRISAEQLSLPEKEVLALLITDLLNGNYDARVQLLATGALAIKAGGSAIVKTANTIYALTVAIATGLVTLVTKAASDMAALAGTVTAAKFNVFCFFIDSAGTLTSAMGTEGATLATVVFPTFPPGKACIGFVIINPTGTGNFVGGTTALDDGTVIPNAVYVNTLGGINPTLTQSIIA